MHLSQIILPLNILQTAVSFPYNSGMWIGENILHGDIGESAAPLFFMHTLLAAAVVMVTFTLLIWLLVRASVRLAVRRGAAPLTLNA
jgi:hypothetical protein